MGLVKSPTSTIAYTNIKGIHKGTLLQQNVHFRKALSNHWNSKIPLPKITTEIDQVFTFSGAMSLYTILKKNNRNT